MRGVVRSRGMWGTHSRNQQKVETSNMKRDLQGIAGPQRPMAERKSHGFRPGMGPWLLTSFSSLLMGKANGAVHPTPFE